ncbi:type II toxin-antitoxin system PemK/MazF family toxin [Loigolactobacillus zhaoyuanensis]|uniref:type II toxin-antitoxin system PemK/MazF family toxin n=1 Tax=Loigolactobacillus zhaoyuanensis TaxID=2486017 RepID=UPI001CDBB255|nr:type II toxin-antitoxin system PemK/MazF family toxin [Loigolactobacillus zhaoyuanensis]
MAAKTQIIKQGGIYWVTAEPHAGHEEGGHALNNDNIRRPVVVVSNNRYNQAKMALVFPITSVQKKSRYLLSIKLKKPSSIILTQILGYDMIARQAEYAGVNIEQEQLDYLRNIVVHML